ncbi:alpha/beta hydrolase [Natranaerofaba carboxydovora]|uniref:alpha/beta hydrolase n=1 Tax=Natranaerofaba carboxydovora TaxID=2742683 RepID=UPI001F145A3E|nr:alpha/beta fold hydrolase [Natranaerofaba carboxydovora]UMZ73437.1 Serine aminopeptidase, S33 [Natranaerofaba carboxydovora]
MITDKLNIEVDGLNIVGWTYKKEEKAASNKKDPLLIICHGIPGQKKPIFNQDSEGDGGYPALAKQCVEAGFSVFHFNFRGTEESEGNFDLKGWVRDLRAVIDYLDNSYPGGTGENGVYLWGFSAGAAVSSYIASEDSRIKGLVLAACPADFEELFLESKLDDVIKEFRDRGILRDLEFPSDSKGWLQDIHDIKPIKYIAKVTPTPILIVHGDEDELISYQKAYDIYKKALEPKEIKIIPGAKHQLRKDERAVKTCIEWLSQMA